MTLFRTTAVLAALAASAFAQEPQLKDSGLRVRALSFQLDSPPPTVFAHVTGGPGKDPGVQLGVKSYLNHEFGSLPAGAGVVFTTGADPASVGKPALVIAKASFPQGFTRGILMFLPGTGKVGDPPFRVLVIPDTAREFPAGSVKILNLSPRQVRLGLEKEVLEFKSGEAKVVSNPPVGQNNSTGMKAFALDDDGQWRRIASGAWPHPGEKRVLQILFLNPATGQVEIRGVRDVSPSLQ